MKDTSVYHFRLYSHDAEQAKQVLKHKPHAKFMIEIDPKMVNDLDADKINTFLDHYESIKASVDLVAIGNEPMNHG